MDVISNNRSNRARRKQHIEIKSEINDEIVYENITETPKYEDPLRTNTRYKCEKCEMSYSKKEYLRNHMLKQHNEVLQPKQNHPKLIPTEDNPRPYKCDQCEKDYTCMKHLLRHKKQSHNNAPRSKLPDWTNDAEDNDRTGDSAEVTKIVLLKPVDAQNCPQLEEQQLHKCDLCDKAYRYTQGLARHKKQSHKASNNKPNLPTRRSETAYNPLPIQHEFIKQELNINDEDVYSEWVSYEPLSEDRDINLKQEYDMNSPTEPEVCVNHTKVKQDTSEVTCSTPDMVKYSYQCEKCQMVYAKRETLIFHLLREHGIKLERKSALVATPENPRPYKCHLCEKDYTCQKHLTRHLNDIHKIKLRTEPETFVKRYTVEQIEENNLKEEIKCEFSPENNAFSDNSGTSVPPSKTEKKKKSSTNRSKNIIKKYKSLKKKGIAAVQKPAPNFRHKCTECNNIYVKRTSLANHMLKQHDQKLGPARPPKLIPTADNPRPYKCDVCESSYVRKKHLSRHVKKSHEQRLCKLCSAPVTGSYPEHMHKAHGIELPRPLECELCSRSFRTKSHIQAHMRCHIPQQSDKIYTCKYCNKQFQHPRIYQNHTRTHVDSRPIICYVCGVTVHYSGLRKHLLIHSDVKKYKCEICQRTFREKATLVIHTRTHTGEKPYKCDTCGKGFKDPSTRRVHFRSHSGENPYCCHFCGRRTKQASNLRSHYRYFHKITEITGRQIRFNSRIFARFTKEQIDAELLEFGDLTRLLTVGRDEYIKEEENKHQIKESVPTADIPSQVENKTEYAPLLVKQAEPGSDDNNFSDSFQNDKVDDESSNRYAATPTISLKIEPEPIKIIECKYEIIECETESITSEIIREYSDEFSDYLTPESPKPKPRRQRNRRLTGKCKLCDLKHSDSTAHRLKFHPESTGLERPFECFDCHHDFSHLRKLSRHLKDHKDHEPVVCYICGLVFKGNRRMQKHLKSHSTERPNKCHLCPKTFKVRINLRNHILNHTGEKPHQCEVCSEQFTLLSSLKLHRRRHTGEKPYLCKHCNKSFSDGSTLKQHIRIHTGDKPYVCHLCGRGCTQAGNLKSHYRHYHKLIVKNVSMYAKVVTVEQNGSF